MQHFLTEFFAFGCVSSARRKYWIQIHKLWFVGVWGGGSGSSAHEAETPETKSATMALPKGKTPSVVEVLAIGG